MPANYTDEFYEVTPKNRVKCIYITYREFRERQSKGEGCLFEFYDDAVRFAKDNSVCRY